MSVIEKADESAAPAIFLKLNGGTRRFGEVTLARFDRLAVRAGLDRDRVRAVATETVARLRDSWPQVRGNLPVPAFVADHITDRLASLPLMRVS